jgi:chemotaxis family two-component system response regulator Rcp1
MVQRDALGAYVAFTWPIRVPEVRAAASGVLGTAPAGHAANDGSAVRSSGAWRLDHGNGIEDPVLLRRAQAVAVSAEGPDRAPARILVIEDSDSDVCLLKLALKKQEFLFELVRLLNGGEAIAFVRRLGCYGNTPIPDLILVDLNPSKLGGDDLLHEIRSAGHLVGVPVCVWGSTQSASDEALLRNLGVCKFITKSAGLDEFMEIGKTIKELLARPKAA